MVMALTIAVLVAGSVYLVLQRGMVRVIFGMSLFGHASNLTLLAAGVDPVSAIATNKVQGSFGAGTAAVSYARSGLVDLRQQWGTALIAFAAGAAGAALVTWLPTQALRVVLPVILLGIAAFFAKRKPRWQG